MADSDNKLNKFIEGELQVLSPLMAKSQELAKAAAKVEITDKVSYGDAKKVKRELVSHRTGVKDMRLTFTRKLDDLKSQFIAKEDEVLQPSIAAEAIVKEKIGEYEDEQQRLKELEEKRIGSITSKIAEIQLGIDRKTGTLEDVKRSRAAVKMELGLLDPKDRTKVAIKKAVEETREWLDETEQFITDRIEQERIAEEQRKEQERLDAERKKLEDDKADAKFNTVKEVHEALSEAPIAPVEAAKNVEKIIDAPNEFLLPDELGWECNDKISEYIDEWAKTYVSFMKKTGDDNTALWEISKAQLMDNIYAIIKKYQEKK